MSITPVLADTLPHVFGIVRERTGVDFSVYRVATMERRVLNHMVSTGIVRPEEYIAHLEQSHDAAWSLLEKLTIKVSSFYRNPETFDALRSHVLPQLGAARRGAPLRIWSAGCASGEEPYTLAMLLDEAGLDGDIIATDIDESALQFAEAGHYEGATASPLPRDLAERYLAGHSTASRLVTVDPRLRERIVFKRHDITSSELPLDTHFDLLCCRNVLIYLQRDKQQSVMKTLRRAVAPQGYLCLGESEWPTPEIMMSLSPLSRKTRLFHGVSGARAWGLRL